MRVDTLRFGEVEVPEWGVLIFPRGLWGFPRARRFCLLPYRPHHPVRWLQSLDDPTLAFLTVQPHDFFPHYEVELSEADAAALRLERAEDAVVLALLTVSRETGAVTANLAGPVLINARTRRGRQVVLDDARYAPRHLVASLRETVLGEEA